MSRRCRPGTLNRPKAINSTEPQTMVDPATPVLASWEHEDAARGVPLRSRRTRTFAAGTWRLLTTCARKDGSRRNEYLLNALTAGSPLLLRGVDASAGRRRRVSAHANTRAVTDTFCRDARSGHRVHPRRRRLAAFLGALGLRTPP